MQHGELKVTERQDRTPVCPWCENELDEVYRRDEGSSFGYRNRVYFCPHCSKVLGIGITN